MKEVEVKKILLKYVDEHEIPEGFVKDMLRGLITREYKVCSCCEMSFVKPGEDCCVCGKGGRNE